jgi:ComF family protein
VSFRDLLLDALFPVDCLGCAARLTGATARLGPWCTRCRTAAPPPPSPLCGCCGVPLAVREAGGVANRCVSCRAHAPAFTVARGAALYDATATASSFVSAVQALKYRADRSLAHALADLIVVRLPIPRHALIVPVPLHRRRLRERRYNQAALIAHAVADRVGRPVAGRALIRALAGPAQATLGAEARRRNLRDAFVVARPADVRDRRILLIDDVITTGATADACARALLQAGARRVDAYAAGRTPRPIP